MKPESFLVVWAGYEIHHFCNPAIGSQRDAWSTLEQGYLKLRADRGFICEFTRMDANLNSIREDWRKFADSPSALSRPCTLELAS
jgi:hypothetical protein